MVRNWEKWILIGILFVLCIYGIKIENKYFWYLGFKIVLVFILEILIKCMVVFEIFDVLLLFYRGL